MIQLTLSVLDKYVGRKDRGRFTKQFCTGISFGSRYVTVSIHFISRISRHQLDHFDEKCRTFQKKSSLPLLSHAKGSAQTQRISAQIDNKQNDDMD